MITAYNIVEKPPQSINWTREKLFFPDRSSVCLINRPGFPCPDIAHPAGMPHHALQLKESSLLVATEQTFREQFAIDVRTRCGAIDISPKEKSVQLRNVITGEVTPESYDKLVLSPGAAPIRPPLPGIDLPGVLGVRTVPDVRAIREWIEGHMSDPSGMDAYTGFQTLMPAKRAVVVGGGFIGIEMAENLIHLGLQVTLLQKGDQVLSPMDPEMARYVERHLEKNGVRLVLNADVCEFKQAAHGSLDVLTESGQVYPADLVVLGIGVRPENWLAKKAGLEIGERGGIRVDDHMRTTSSTAS